MISFFFHFFICSLSSRRSQMATWWTHLDSTCHGWLMSYVDDCNTAILYNSRPVICWIAAGYRLLVTQCVGGLCEWWCLDNTWQHKYMHMQNLFMTRKENTCQHVSVDNVQYLHPTYHFSYLYIQMCGNAYCEYFCMLFHFIVIHWHSFK